MIRALITEREEINKNGDKVDSLEKTYVDYFSQIGITVFPLSNFSDTKAVLESIVWDLIILSGGGDLSSDAYTYERNCIVYEERLRVEHLLVNHALINKIPIIGICRGMQYINYFLGGEINSLEDCQTRRIIGLSHKVKTEDDIFSVNHYHSDGISRCNLSDKLRILACDADNDIVEAFGGKSDNIIGIQWHPERIGNDSKAERWVRDIISGLLSRK